MINKDKFLSFLGYIGLREERKKERIYKYYQKCYNKRYKMSKFKKYIVFLGFEEGCAETIAEYILYPEKRYHLDNEVKYFKGEWTKEFKLGELK